MTKISKTDNSKGIRKNGKRWMLDFSHRGARYQYIEIIKKMIEIIID